MINPFVILPKDIFNLILSFTTGKEVTKLTEVSKVFYRTLHDSQEIICCRVDFYPNIVGALQIKPSDEIIKIIHFVFKLKTVNKELFFNNQQIKNFIIYEISNNKLDVVKELINYTNKSTDLVEIVSNEGILMKPEVKDKIIYEVLNQINLKDLSLSSLSALLRAASQTCHVEIVKCILKNPGIESDVCASALVRASEKNHPKVITELLQYIGINSYNLEPDALVSVCIKGHLAVVNELLREKSIDPGAEDSASIRWASYNNHIEIVRVLLKDPRVDPSAMGNHALTLARGAGHIDVVNELLLDPRVRAAEEINLKDLQLPNSKEKKCRIS